MSNQDQYRNCKAMLCEGLRYQFPNSTYSKLTSFYVTIYSLLSIPPTTSYWYLLFIFDSVTSFIISPSAQLLTQKLSMQVFCPHHCLNPHNSCQSLSLYFHLRGSHSIPWFTYAFLGLNLHRTFFFNISLFTMMYSSQEEYNSTQIRNEQFLRRSEEKYHDLLHSFKICTGRIYFGFSNQYITVRPTSISLFVKKRDWTDSDGLNRERLEVRAVGLVCQEVTHIAQVSETED